MFDHITVENPRIPWYSHNSPLPCSPLFQTNKCTLTSGECCLAGACNWQSSTKGKTKKLRHILPKSSTSPMQTSDNRTQSVYLSDHVRVDTSNQLDTDEDCKQSYSACNTEVHVESDQNMHIVTGEKRFTCQVCDMRFNQLGKLGIHMRVHTREQTVDTSNQLDTDEDCKQSSSEAEMHKKNDQHMFSCEVCGRKFLKPSTLKTHMLIHTGERLFSCRFCDKSYTRSNDLKKHMRSHSAESLFTCEVCDKKFVEAGKLQTHMLGHVDRPLICEVCDKKFSYSSHLSRHMRIHTGEKPFSCEVCDRTFSQPSNLTAHMRIHSGERPFSCNICDKKCSKSSDLRTHMLTHTGERPYTCYVCNKKFTTTSNLATHMRIHAVERMFSCEVCGKKFTSSYCVKRHMSVHKCE